MKDGIYKDEEKKEGETEEGKKIEEPKPCKAELERNKEIKEKAVKNSKKLEAELNDKPTEASIEDAIRAADKGEAELEKRKLK